MKRITGRKSGLMRNSGKKNGLRFEPLEQRNMLAVVIGSGDDWDFNDNIVNELDPAGALDYPSDIFGGIEWNQPGFDIANSDIPWETGPTPFETPGGSGINAFGGLVTTDLDGLDAAPGGENLVTTYLFRKEFNVTAEQAAASQATIHILADDSVIIYINGERAAELNPPPCFCESGLDPFDTTVLSAVGNEDVYSDLVVDLDVLAVGLVAGTNTIAVELHQQSLTSSDAGFDFELTVVTGPQGVDDAYSTNENGTLTVDLPIALSSIMRMDWDADWVYVDTLNNGADGNPVDDYPVDIFGGAAWNEFDFDIAQSDIPWAMDFGPFELGGVNFLTALDPAPLQGSSANNTTYLYRSTFQSTADVTSLTLNLLADDGAIVYINGTEVLLQNMQTAPDTTTFSVGTGNEDVPTSTTVDVSGLMRDGANVVAVEVHQANLTSSDTGMGLQVFESGPTAGVLSNDIPQAGGTLTAAVDTGPANGTLTLNADGTFEYIPNADFFGVDTFTYIATENNDKSSDPVTVTITVNQVPGPPIAVDDTYSVAAGQTLSVLFVDAAETFGLGEPDVTVLVSANSTWVYLDDGSDQGTSWRESAFNDGVGSGWVQELDNDAAGVPNEGGPYGYGGNGEVATVSFGPDDTMKFATTYFRHRFNVADPSAFDNDLIAHVLRDDGVAVYLNGTEILRDNLDADATFDVFAQGTVGGADETTFFPFIINKDLLVAGENVLAVEVHQAGGGSSDLGFDLELVAPSSGFGVLNNDSDDDGDPLTASIKTGPSNGTVTMDATGTFTYTPDAGFEGQDSFTYEANDGTFSSEATVTVNVGGAVANPLDLNGDGVIGVEDVRLMQAKVVGGQANAADFRSLADLFGQSVAASPAASAGFGFNAEQDGDPGAEHTPGDRTAALDRIFSGLLEHAPEDVVLRLESRLAKVRQRVQDAIDHVNPGDVDPGDVDPGDINPGDIDSHGVRARMFARHLRDHSGEIRDHIRDDISDLQDQFSGLRDRLDAFFGRMG